MAKTYLELGRLAMDSPELYWELYGQDPVTCLLQIKKDPKRTPLLFSALFGYGVGLHRAGFLPTVAFLRLCDKSDELLGALTDSAKAGAALESAVDIFEHACSAILFVYKAGCTVYDPFTGKREFRFDPVRLRQVLGSEYLADKNFRGIKDRREQRLLRQIAEKSSDRELVQRISFATGEMVKELVALLGDKEIRNVKNASEEYFRAHYAVEDTVIMRLRDIVEDSRNTERYYNQKVAILQQAYERIELMNIPSNLLTLQLLYLNEVRVLSMLARHMASLEEVTDEDRKLVGDTYMGFQRLFVDLKPTDEMAEINKLCEDYIQALELKLQPVAC